MSAWWAWGPSCPKCSPPPRTWRRTVSPATSSASLRPTLSSGPSRPAGAWPARPFGVLETLFPPSERRRWSLSWTATRTRCLFSGPSIPPRLACLGVSDFGQVGEVDDLYRHFGIDAATIVGAAWDLLDEFGQGQGRRQDDRA